MKRAIDDDIEDYFAMQERKTAKGKAVPPAAPRPPDPTIEEPKIDITVEESAGEFGPDTIVEKINQFWKR
jgi:hypothetical protein